MAEYLRIVQISAKATENAEIIQKNSLLFTNFRKLYERLFAE